ncbi:MAG TPA: hypothetical protein VHH73_00005, partial [Verrucomicrobiae bacterium]|nr:hypothetical protein [Verrucomicrobiae bacterium]
MRFVWFWTFWHWSVESFRAGVLLRGPLEGVGGHWDEWYRHEASPEDRRAIEKIAQDEFAQREFVAWIFRRWRREASQPKCRINPRFVLGQIARLPPFDRWPVFAKYRSGYGAAGISAVVLAEGSPGVPADVRPVEALVLPVTNTTGPAIVSEGFHATTTDLGTPSQTVGSLLGGKGLLSFLAVWIASGRRPWPRWMRVVLGFGWLAAGALILFLLFGPDPEARLVSLTGILAGLWITLVVVATTTSSFQCLRAWEAGKSWRSDLEKSQLRLRMEGGLTLEGASAGLPFCLNTLLALYRARPSTARRSWLWRGFFQNLRANSAAWAATGVVTPSGQIKAVVLEPKLRACHQHAGIGHILTPRQRDATPSSIRKEALSSAKAPSPASPNLPLGAIPRLGFAAEATVLQSHPCRHFAGVFMTLGGFFSRWQVAVNLLALAVTITMLAALGDVRAILIPPPSPAAVRPGS